MWVWRYDYNTTFCLSAHWLTGVIKSTDVSLGEMSALCSSSVLRAVCDVKVNTSLHATLPLWGNRRAWGSFQKPKYPHHCRYIITDVYQSDRHDDGVKGAFVSLNESVFEMLLRHCCHMFQCVLRLSSGQLKAQSCRKLHSSGLCFRGCSLSVWGTLCLVGWLGN